MSQQYQESTVLPHTSTTAMPSEQAAEDALFDRLAACRWENHHAHHPPLLANLPWQAPTGMEEYLQVTKLCNFDHPAVCAKAAEIVADAPTPQQAAMRIFTFVRDQIRFGLVHPMDETALMTLERGMGQCSAKSNLQVALLRAAQIPARFHVVAVDRRSLRGLVPSLIYRLFGPSLWHPWAELYLDGQWRACDTLIDQPLYFSATQQGIIQPTQIPTIDWDGTEDLLLLKPWIVEEVGTFTTLEAALAKMPKSMVPPKALARLAFAYSNRYTARLRSRGNAVSIEESPRQQ